MINKERQLNISYYSSNLTNETELEHNILQIKTNRWIYKRHAHKCKRKGSYREWAKIKWGKEGREREIEEKTIGIRLNWAKQECKHAEERRRERVGKERHVEWNKEKE